MAGTTILSLLLAVGATQALPAKLQAGQKAPAAPIVDYSKFNLTSYVPFYNKDNVNFKDAPKIKLTAGGIPIVATMDTGSTGIVVPKKVFPRNSQQGYLDANCTVGHIFYSSSKWLEQGYWCKVDVTIGDNIHTKPEVLVLDSEVCCPKYNATSDGERCPTAKKAAPCVCKGTCDTPTKRQLAEEPEIKDKAYMGVGFGRAGMSKQNLFWNVIKINGQDTTTENYRQGYVITSQGVHIGLTRNNTANFGIAKMKLREPAGDERDWNEPPIAISVNGGKFIDGLMLPDTGINNAFLTAGVPKAKGDEITVRFPNNANGLVEWKIHNLPKNESSNDVNPMQPKGVTGNGSRVELNTGRHLFNGFDTLVDADKGFYGMKRKDGAREFGKML